MKRILAFLALCAFLTGCAAQLPPETVPSTEPSVHTLPETEPTDTAVTVPVTQPPSTEPLETAAEETLPPVTEPGPQILYGDTDELALSAQQAFVYDCGTGDLWIWGDWNARIAPASLVKLFTIHVAMQYLSPEAVITAGEEVYLVQPGSSVAAIGYGSRLTAAMLVEGCLVQSGNDAAYVLAAAAGRVLLNDPAASAQAAVGAFVEEMNRQAAEIGLANTYYVNPDGYDAQGQYTCPEDLLAVARLSLADPLVLQYCGIARDSVVFESGENYVWYSTNFLLHKDLGYYAPEAFGLKTGTTNHAGGHLIAAFHAPDRDLLIGVFGCPDKSSRFADALLLYEYAK